MDNKQKLKYQQDIKEKVNRFSKVSNAIFFVGILNIFSFILTLFDKSIPRLSLSLNIFLHSTFMKTFDHQPIGYVFSGLCIFFVSLIFILIFFSIKKGKLIPLIFLSILYLSDTIFLFFLDDNIFLDITNKVVSIFVHIIVLGYFIFLISYYFYIVSTSKNNQRKLQEKEEK